MDLKLSKYVLVSAAITDNSQNEPYRIIFSTRRGMGIKLTENGYRVLVENRWDLFPDRLFTILMYHEIVIPADEDELEEIISCKKLRSNDQLLYQQIHYVEKYADCNVLAESLGADEEVELHIHLSGDQLIQAMELKYYLESKLRDRTGLRLKYTFHASHVEEGELEDSLPLSLTDIMGVKFYIKFNENSYIKELLKSVNNLESIPSIDLIIEEGEYEQVFYDTLDDLLQKESIQVIVQPNGQRTSNVLHYVGNEVRRVKVLPEATSTYYWVSSTEKSRSLFAPPNSKPVEYDKKIEEALLSNQLQCSDCKYLPMCGGHLENLKEDPVACPSYIDSFMDRTFVKYGISLAG